MYLTILLPALAAFAAAEADLAKRQGSTVTFPTSITTFPASLPSDYTSVQLSTTATGDGERCVLDTTNSGVLSIQTRTDCTQPTVIISGTSKPSHNSVSHATTSTESTTLSTATGTGTGTPASATSATPTGGARIACLGADGVTFMVVGIAMALGFGW
ncbi:uncharacterized protein BCR38DRAFT_437423 [Pseudomassariella vexata]|uniref:GPI anchored protein n=1 Tax=Pseudomassariella vexata TaxID=1141098 RepID=A0A1Y2DS36_9PEZI|nr:uncharacterized protein BCR38DRAFT_437423 [Pseudomassariella vexata]ORY62090.1 hypothetical protein BCR38DRAFT_437423 [Pseudomassariella vexata]